MREWTQQEIDDAIAMREQGMPIADIGKRLGRTESSVGSKIRYEQKYKNEPKKDSGSTPSNLEEVSYSFENAALKHQLKEMAGKLEEIKGTVSIEEEWADEFDGPSEWARAERKGVSNIRKAQKRGKFNVSFDSGPIAISVISDQHIAPNTACDFVRMKEDAELIRNTPGFYAVFGGDGVDNHIKHRSAMIGSRTNPDEQWRLFDYYLQLFGDKILAVISGNHDAWTAQIGGVDYLSKLAEKNKICYAPAEARLNINVAGQEYKMVVRPQTGRFNSSLNQTHAVKRFYEYGEDTFDIGVIGHHHEAAVEMFIRHGLKRYAARPGSYQISSPYSHQYGFANAIPTCPTFILFPKERRMIGFADVRDAVWAWNRGVVKDS